MTDDLERFERKKKLVESLVPKKVVPKRKSKKERQLEAETGRLRNIEKKKKKDSRIAELKGLLELSEDPQLKKPMQAELLNLLGKSRPPAKKKKARGKKKNEQVLGKGYKDARLELVELKAKFKKARGKLKLRPTNEGLLNNADKLKTKILRKELDVARYKQNAAPKNKTLIARVASLRSRLNKEMGPKSQSIRTVSGGLPSLGKR